MRLYCTYFTFTEIKGDLTKEKDNRVLDIKTPAKECRITKNKWTLTYLLNYIFSQNIN